VSTERKEKKAQAAESTFPLLGQLDHSHLISRPSRHHLASVASSIITEQENPTQNTASVFLRTERIPSPPTPRAPQLSSATYSDCPVPWGSARPCCNGRPSGGGSGGSSSSLSQGAARRRPYTSSGTAPASRPGQRRSSSTAHHTALAARGYSHRRPATARRGAGSAGTSATTAWTCWAGGSTRRRPGSRAAAPEASRRWSRW
jgi:hypothetical protein